MALWPGMKAMLCRPVGLRYLCCTLWLQHPPVSGLNSLPGAVAGVDFPHPPPFPTGCRSRPSAGSPPLLEMRHFFFAPLVWFYQISKLRLCSQSEVKCRRKVQHHALENSYCITLALIAKCTTAAAWGDRAGYATTSRSTPTFIINRSMTQVSNHDPAELQGLSVQQRLNQGKFIL